MFSTVVAISLRRTPLPYTWYYILSPSLRPRLPSVSRVLRCPAAKRDKFIVTGLGGASVRKESRLDSMFMRVLPRATVRSSFFVPSKQVYHRVFISSSPTAPARVPGKEGVGEPTRVPGKEGVGEGRERGAEDCSRRKRPEAFFYPRDIRSSSIFRLLLILLLMHRQ